MNNRSELAVRELQEKEEHVARVSARMKELRAQGLTQAADEKRETLLVLRRDLAKDRERLL